ncbi:MAG: helix-turn-helix domain-containing protein [Nitrospirae bacterium]|nr:helix-turn-helix domain-containing protein [Nitrospirota bacterium]
MKKENSGWEAFAKIQVLEGVETTEVIVNGRPYMKWVTGDEVTKRIAIIQLYETGKGTQDEISKAFGIHLNTVYNYINAFKREGINGILIQTSGPKQAHKITPEIKFKILEVAYSNMKCRLEDIKEILKKRWNEEVSVSSIRRVLIENGFMREEAGKNDLWIRQETLFSAMDNVQLELDFREKETELKKDFMLEEVKINKEQTTGNYDNENKAKRVYSSAQRIYLDQLEQSSYELKIEKGEYNTYAGGLLFVPLLKRYNFIPMIKRIIDINTHEGYSLEELCLTLFYFDIFEFESIENFKTVYPEEFGILTGKLRSPSIWTLRRFLHKVRGFKKGEQLMDEFAKEYLKSGIVKWGVLYIDGHFLPYYGIRTITMGLHTVRNKILKGSYNFMASDAEFNPLVFLIRPSSEDLIEKIPEIIAKARKIAEEVGIDGKVLTVIFDREGYSGALYRKLDEIGVRLISYAKYTDKWVYDYKNEEFNKSVMVKYEIQESKEIKYFETERRMPKYGKMRAIVIKSSTDNRRTAIHTNDKDGDAGEIIELLCRHWGHENLNKALKLNHLIDYYPGYVSEELEEQPLVDNPELEELKQRRATLKSHLHGLELTLAKKILKETKDDTNWKEIKTKEIETLSQITGIESQITLLNQKIDELPKEKLYDEAHEGRRLVELDYEKKRFLDCIKVFSYHMEKKMCELLAKYYDVPNVKKEIWSALGMIVRRGAHVRLEEGRLTVKLRRFKDPEINYAARHVCEELNQMKPFTLDRFCLPIYYEVA